MANPYKDPKTGKFKESEWKSKIMEDLKKIPYTKVIEKYKGKVALPTIYRYIAEYNNSLISKHLIDKLKEDNPAIFAIAPFIEQTLEVLMKETQSVYEDGRVSNKGLRLAKYIPVYREIYDLIEKLMGRSATKGNPKRKFSGSAVGGADSVKITPKGG